MVNSLHVGCCLCPTRISGTDGQGILIYDAITTVLMPESQMLLLGNRIV